jgi:hypothetical protein
MRIVLSVLLIVLIFGCDRRPFVSRVPPGGVEYKDNTAFYSFENLSSPKLSALRMKYHLDTVFHGEQNEFKRMLLLRDWIHRVIKIGDFEESYPGDGFAEKILDAGLQGQGFHCGHFMIVQNAVMNSFGYVTRCLGAGPGVKGGPDGHHGINEIWSNPFQKWFLSDAKYNHHFEKNGIPLSALEIRDEYLRNSAADILLVKGPGRMSIDADGVADRKGKMIQTAKSEFARTYTWIEWEAINNRFTGWPENADTLSKLNMFADDYFKGHTWIWDGKPHWAYHTNYMILINDRDAIEWTPNVISAKVTMAGAEAQIELSSFTPNLKTYQLKELPGGDWKDIPGSIQIGLKSNKNELLFRAVNVAGVTGPERRVIIERSF